MQRRGKDLERFVNLWRLAVLSALTSTLLATQLSAGGLRPEQEWALLALGVLLFASLAFQLYLAWFSWSERFGLWVVGADLGVVAGLLLGFVIADRPLVATNSQTTFMGYFIVIALAGLRSDSRVARGLAAAVPLSYALAVFLAVAWRQAPYLRPDPYYGSFSWDTQVIRLVLLTAFTWITQYDVALGAADRAEAQRDPLTGVYNRRFLEEFLSRELPRARRRHQPLSVLLADLDGFKQYNDTYGHLAGDEMLAAVAASLAAAVRGADIVARYGGDEFIIVLPDTPGETARRVARELTGVVPRQVRLSIGVGCLGERHASAQALLEAADRALLRAKQEGGGAVVAV